MSGKILLFAFDQLPRIAAVDQAAKSVGAEIVPVPRSAYQTPLAVLAGEQKAKTPPRPFSGGPLGGEMMVFCGLSEEQLDGLLSALRRAGIGPDCLKAVLTAHNRNWNALTLFGELSAEHRAMNRRG